MGREVRQKTNRTTPPDLEGLRRLGVWLPAMALGVLFSLLWAHHLHDVIYLIIHFVVVGIITGGAYFFSRYIFRIVHQKEQEIFRRNRELATLNAVGNVINEAFHLDEILTRVLDKILEMTGAESGEIFLIEEGTNELSLRTFRGGAPEAFREITRFAFSEGCVGRIARSGQPLVTFDLTAEPSFLRRRVIEAGYRAFIGVPLKSKGRVVGVMDVAALEATKLASTEVELLISLGNQVGVAVENARLYARLKEMTILEERQRIAREMHDGLAQELSYFHFKLRELEANLPSQSLARFRDELQHLRTATARACEDVRQAIFGLRMVSTDNIGLVSSLTEYLQEFGELTGIATELKIADAHTPHFPLQVEVQLIRIIQEALTNVRKHARARCVLVDFTSEAGQAKVTVQDDGQGFDADEVARRGLASFGLQTMRERAESVHGRLKVVSHPGAGTQVSVWLPMEEQEVVAWKP